METFEINLLKAALKLVGTEKKKDIMKNFAQIVAREKKESEKRRNADEERWQAKEEKRQKKRENRSLMVYAAVGILVVVAVCLAAAAYIM